MALIVLVLRALRKVGFLKYLNLSLPKVIGTDTYNIPVLGDIGLDNYLHPHEPWMNTLLQRLKDSDRRNGLFLDVGVNLGQTLLTLNSVIPEMKYIGFEPNPICCHYLKVLIERNQLMNAEVVPAGLSDHSSVARLNIFSSSRVDASASTLEGFRQDSKVHSSAYVGVYNFDEIDIDVDATVSIVKVDVEGSELEVLMGMRKMITKDRPILIAEILPIHPENAFRLQRKMAIEQFCAELDYQMLHVKKDRDTFGGLQLLEDIPLGTPLHESDYVIVPREDIGALLRTD